MYPIGIIVGWVIGGTITIYLISKLIEWAIVKRVLNNAILGGFLSIFLSYLLASTIYGFGSANGGPWTGKGFFIYIPGAVIVALIRMVVRKRNIERAEA